MTTPDIDAADLPLATLFARWPAAASAFLDRRMLCPGCPVAPFHTVIDACAEYGLEEAPFRAAIRAAASRTAAAPGAGDAPAACPRT